MTRFYILAVFVAIATAAAANKSWPVVAEASNSATFPVYPTYPVEYPTTFPVYPTECHPYPGC